MSDRLNYPPERDFGFYQRRKHDKWRAVSAPEPSLEGPVADSHAHVHMLPDPAWELARCVANNVRFVCEICDPSEDDPHTIESGFLTLTEIPCDKKPGFLSPTEKVSDKKPGFLSRSEKVDELALRVAAGVHPHNAKLYDEEIEERLLRWLSAPEAAVVGEIGLDFHYDLSPRDVQRRVFRRQIQLAKELGMPIALHLRGGEDPQADNAHREAFRILSEVGFPEKGTILHCCALPPEELKSWIEADCYIAYGGALTFKNADDARAGALIVPDDRLLLETDSPYMTPEPMRGAACTPAHVIFTAAFLAELRGHAPGSERERFLAQVYQNTLRFFEAQ